jgi:hypothetical protein
MGLFLGKTYFGSTKQNAFFGSVKQKTRFEAILSIEVDLSGLI